MPANSFICPHCGKADWSRAPRMRAVLVFLRGRRGVTARDVVDAFGVSIANASNYLNRLVRLGLARRSEAEPNPGGGLFHIYHATEAEL
jgi:predicted transcriptional regulator